MTIESSYPTIGPPRRQSLENCEENVRLFDTVAPLGLIELFLHYIPVPTPGANEALVRASPTNASDLRLLLAGAA
jgi:hypothetical protein